MRDRPPIAQATALRLSKFVDPSPFLRPVPEAAVKRRSKPPTVLVPTTTRRFSVSATLATMTSAATKSATAETSQSSAPAQAAEIPAPSVTTAKRDAMFAAEEAADIAEKKMSMMTVMTATTVIPAIAPSPVIPVVTAASLNPVAATTLISLLPLMTATANILPLMTTTNALVPLMTANTLVPLKTAITEMKILFQSPMKSLTITVLQKKLGTDSNVAEESYQI